MPTLILYFRDTESVNKRTAILDILNGFLSATETVFVDGEDPETIPVSVVKDDLFEVYSKGFWEVAQRKGRTSWPL